MKSKTIYSSLSIFWLVASAFLVVTTADEETEEEQLDYPVDPIDVIKYIELGKPCDPDNKDPKKGICRATLYCDRNSKLCDCEDTGPYKYTEDDRECKNYVGSRCYSDSCVANATCDASSNCVCDTGKICKDKKVPVKPL